MINVLQLNANRIGNKLAELGVVMENNKVKVAVIQESKLTPELHHSSLISGSRKLSSHIVLTGLSHKFSGVKVVGWTVQYNKWGTSCGSIPQSGQLEDSVCFSLISKVSSSAESLYDPHLEELAIEAEIGNTKLIISNIYIPPASSGSNGYQSSIEHLPTTQDSRILGDFNAHHSSWYSGSTDTRGRKMPTQSMDITMVFLTGTPPREFHLTQSQVRQMSHQHQHP